MRFNRDDLNVMLAEFLGKPYEAGATGPDAYDCYGLVRAFCARLGVTLPEIGAVGPEGPAHYIQLDQPRPWSLVSFAPKLTIQPHIGVVLPDDNLFLHCPDRRDGSVMAEPLGRRPWRDQIDGFWWPRDLLEVVLLLSPMNRKQRAWQFVSLDGRTLREIIVQDITAGETIPLQAFLGGELVEPADWDLVPTPGDQLVIRPEFGSGKQAGMAAGMIALAVFAPYIAGPIAGVEGGAGAAAAAAAAGTGPAVIYAVANAAIMMGGAMALNALVGPDEADAGDSQAYGWNPRTTQRVGAPEPLVYGTFAARGNVLCSYAEGDLNETVMNVFTTTSGVRSAKDRYYLKIGYGDGPIEGPVAETVELSGQRLAELDPTEVTVAHFRGTSDQAASTIPDRFEIPVGVAVGGSNSDPVTADFYAIDCDDVAVIVYCPNGLTDYTSDGDHKRVEVNVDIKIRVYGEDAWFTVFDSEINGNSQQPVRLLFSMSGLGYGNSWDDQTQPYNIEPGTRYEIRVDRSDSVHGDKGNLFRFEGIQFGFFHPQRHPGRAYTAIGAVASEDLNGAIEFYAEVKGKIVRVYDDEAETWSIQWSDNPAWVAYDVLTRPVISGHGPAVAAQGTLTMLAHPDVGDTVTIDGVTYRFKGTPDQINDVFRGANRAATQDHLVKTINGTGVAGTDYYAGSTSPHTTVQIAAFDVNDRAVLTAVTAGAAGNEIATTSEFSHTRNHFDDTTLGDTTLGLAALAYAVDYYRRVDPTHLTLADFVAFADWCDELIDDGRGGTEKRYVFNGTIDTETTVWEAAVKVCKMACAAPWFTGTTVRIAIDKPGTPVQMFNISNLRSGFTETWIDTSEAATEFDVEICDEESDYGREIYTVTRPEVEEQVVATLDGFGHTSRRQAWRYATRQLRVNQYMRRAVEIPAILDAIYAEPGDIVYVQHPALQRADGGRITAVAGSTITTDKAVSMGAGAHALLIRTHDGTQDRVTLYVATGVSGDKSNIVTISGVFAYTPAANDLWVFGPTTQVTDLYRIRGFERTGDGTVLIQAAQYTTDYYTDDEDAPRIEPQVYSTTKGARAASLTPTTAEGAAGLGYQDAGAATDAIGFSGLAFTGDDADTVTWACTGEGVKYQGSWCPINDDAVGTTDKYIYWDPEAADPRDLASTDDLSDLAGEERYLFCINVNGVATFKPGVLVAKDGALVDLDDMDESATRKFAGESGADVTANNQIRTFHETFEDPNDDVVTRWGTGTGNASISIVAAAGVSGGNVLRLGDNDGNDFVKLLYYRLTEFDPSSGYRVRIRARQTAGTGPFYAGLQGYAVNGTTIVNPDGESSHWFIAKAKELSSSWEVITAYLQGNSVAGDATEHLTASDPAKLIDTAAYFAVEIYANFAAEAGQVDIDEIWIDTIPEDADQIAEGTTNKFAAESGADVTADHAGDIDVDSVDESATRKWAAESGADVTGDHTAALITDQGNLATADTVDTAEIDEEAVTSITAAEDATSSDLNPSPGNILDKGFGVWRVGAYTAALTSSGVLAYVTVEGSIDGVDLTAATKAWHTIFRWETSFTAVNISAITLTGTDNIVITTSAAHGLSSDQYVWISDVVGTTELNDGIFGITVVDETHFSLWHTRSDWFTAYTSDGECCRVTKVKQLLAAQLNGVDTPYNISTVDDTMVDGTAYQFIAANRNLHATLTAYNNIGTTIFVMEIKR